MNPLDSWTEAASVYIVDHMTQF